MVQSSAPPAVPTLSQLSEQVFQTFPERLHFPSERCRAELSADCPRVFTARAVRECDSESAGRTFWFPAGGKPRCALEQIVGEMFTWHIGRLGLGEVVNLQSAGCEWWTLWLDGEEDDVGWHWDADYCARELGNMRSPFLATVTYLEDGGGNAPTVVLEDCREDVMDGAAMIHTLHVSLPYPGKHICFDGGLLHAAPMEMLQLFGNVKDTVNNHDLESMVRGKAKMVGKEGTKRGGRKSARTTLLVNLWLDHAPADAQMLSASLASRLSPVVGSSPLSLGKDQPRDPDQVFVKQGTRVNEISWRFGEDDINTVTLPVPRDACGSHDSLTIHYLDGWCGSVG